MNLWSIEESPLQYRNFMKYKQRELTAILPNIELVDGHPMQLPVSITGPHCAKTGFSFPEPSHVICQLVIVFIIYWPKPGFHRVLQFSISHSYVCNERTHWCVQQFRLVGVVLSPSYKLDSACWGQMATMFLYELVTAIDGVSINVGKAAWLMAILRKMTNYDSYKWLCGTGIDYHIRIRPNSIPILPDSGGRVTPNQHCCNFLLKAPPPTFDTFHS